MQFPNFSQLVPCSVNQNTTKPRLKCIEYSLANRSGQQRLKSTRAAGKGVYRVCCSSTFRISSLCLINALANAFVNEFYRSIHE